MERLEKLLLFRVGPAVCCVTSNSVETIIRPPEKETHGHDGNLPEIFRHGGNIARVVDVRKKFGLSAAEASDHGNIILSKTDKGLFAFWVDQIINVIDADEGKWGMLPPKLPRDVFSATFMLKDEIILFTDFANIERMRPSVGLTEHLEHLRRKQEQKVVMEAPTTIVTKPEPTTGGTETETIAAAETRSPEPLQERERQAVTEPPPRPVPPVSPRIEETRPRLEPARPTTTTGRPTPPPSPRITEPKPPEPRPEPVKPVMPNIGKSVQEARPASSPSWERPRPEEATTSRDESHKNTRQDLYDDEDEGGWLFGAAMVLVLLLLVGGGWYFYSSLEGPGSESLTDYTAMAPEDHSSMGHDQDSSPDQGDMDHSAMGQGGMDHSMDTADLDAPAQEATDTSAMDQDTVGTETSPPTDQDSAAPPVEEEGYSATIEKQENVVTITLDGPEDALLTANDNSSEQDSATDTTTDTTTEPPTDMAGDTESQQAGTEEQTPAAPASPKVITHVVVKGDTLWDIAEKYVRDPFKYPELARLSNIKNPDLIYPGDIVRIQVR